MQQNYCLTLELGMNQQYWNKRLNGYIEQLDHIKLQKVNAESIEDKQRLSQEAERVAYEIQIIKGHLTN